MIHKIPIHSDELDRDIMVHIRLPEGYESSSERYPVMYMFDGHNLFSDADATYGKSWGLDAFLSSYDKPFIVVGLECDHRGNNRLDEYSPYPVSDTPIGSLGGRGPLLFSWILSVLKPWVDSTYRTWPHREATGIAGSSMGGLMAYYGLFAHNDVFSKAAALSPSLFVCGPELESLVSGSSISPDTRLYLSRGELEPAWCELSDFVPAGVDNLVVTVPEGTHSEASWEKENPVWFDFLWK